MKKSEIIELFVKEVKNDGTDVYKLFENFVKGLRTKGIIKHSEIPTAYNLPNILKVKGWM